MGAKLAEAAPVIAPEPAPAKKRKRASSTGGASAAAGTTPVKRAGGAPAAAAHRTVGLGDGPKTAINLDFDAEDPLAFFRAQGIPPGVVEQALKACGNDPDRAQVWIMLNHRTSAAGGAADEEQTAAEYQAAQDAYDDMVFERELQAAQLASEKVSAEESRSREAAFDASARAAPLLTFGESSAFLAAVRAVAPLSEAEASALRAPLSELLLLEHRARKAYDQQPARYFSRAGAQFADTQPPLREAFLLQRVDEVGNPSRPGSMYGMPLRGSGGLPDVFSGDAEGALVIDDDVVDLVDAE